MSGRSRRCARRWTALAPWFHNIDLGGGLVTAPDHFLGDYPRFKFARFADALPADLDRQERARYRLQRRLLFGRDEAARRRRACVGIDSDERYLAQARLAAEALGFAGIEFRNLSVYDVAALGERFDLVIFMGVLYHLRHPLLALDLIREHVAGDMLLFQTMQRGSNELIDVPEDHPFHMPDTFEPRRSSTSPAIPKMHFIERRYAGDWTNWWAPNRACSEAMLRAAGFTIESRAGGGGLSLPRRAGALCAIGARAAVYPAKARNGEGA